MKDATELIVNRNRTSEATNVIVGIVALCIGFLVMLSGTRWIGLLIIITGGAVAVFSFVTFLDRKPMIVISKSGLWIRYFSPKMVPWSAITSVKIRAMPRSGTFITIELNAQHRFDFEISGLAQPATLIYKVIREHTVTNDFTE